MMKYELEGVTPFNDVYYIDCVWLAYFTAVKHLNGSIFSYIANNQFLYGLEQTSEGLSLNIKPRQTESLDEIDKYNCINIERIFGSCQDVIDFIKNSILSGSVIVLPIDGFYYKHPYHDLFYLKEHHKNAMLIYGFDSEREVFKTTETNGFQWNSRKCHYKHEISFKDLITGHEGIVNYFQDDPPEPTLLKLSKNGTEKVIDDNPSFYKSKMMNNLNVHKNDIIKGLQNIRILSENIEQFNISETAAFNNLVASASNQYAIKNILGESGGYVQLLDKIVDIWKMIRNLLYMYEFKGVEYDKNTFSAKLSQLYELENELYEDLFTQVDAV